MDEGTGGSDSSAYSMNSAPPAVIMCRNASNSAGLKTRVPLRPWVVSGPDSLDQTEQCTWPPAVPYRARM